MSNDVADRGDEFVPDDEVETKKPADGSEESSETPEPEAKTPEAGDKAPKTEDVDEGSKPPKEGWIPRYRYNSAAQRAREAEERAQQLEAELAQLRSSGSAGASRATTEEAPDYEVLIAAAEEKFAAAVKDGQPDEATAAMREVRRLEREQYQSELRSTSEHSSKEVMESVRFDSLMDDLLSEYESINPDSEKYDRGLAERVVELHEAYMATGRYGLSDAMLKAMEVVFPTAHVEKAAEQEQQPVKKPTDVKRNAEAAAAQPPDTAGVGVDSNRAGMSQIPDAQKLTDDEFERLPEEQKRRMRGDYV